MNSGQRRPTPSAEDVEAFAVMTVGAHSYGLALQAHRDGGPRPGSADPLLKARRACKGRVMPVDQQFRDSPLMRLIRLVDLVGPCQLAERIELADALVKVAREVDPKLAEARPKPAPAPAPEPVARRQRRDIDDMED